MAAEESVPLEDSEKTETSEAADAEIPEAPEPPKISDAADKGKNRENWILVIAVTKNVKPVYGITYIFIITDPFNFDTDPNPT